MINDKDIMEREITEEDVAKMPTHKRYKNRIKQLREETHMTQVACARELNMHPIGLSMIERGVREPTAEQLKKLARLFDASFRQLFAADWEE